MRERILPFMPQMCKTSALNKPEQRSVIGDFGVGESTQTILPDRYFIFLEGNGHQMAPCSAGFFYFLNTRAVTRRQTDGAVAHPDRVMSNQRDGN